MENQTESSWPEVKRVEGFTVPEEITNRRASCLEQHADGAITFIEMVNFLYSTITREEVIEHNKLIEEFFPELKFVGKVQQLIDSME